MRYENIDDTGRIVRCRKNHRCEWCNTLIRKGDNAVVRKYKSDGEFISAHQHLECFEALKKSIVNGECGFYENSFYPGEAKKGKTIRESDFTGKHKCTE
jgi:hypothetical protein